MSDTGHDHGPMVSSEEVYDLLRNAEYNSALGPVCWVMNLEWYKAIRRAFPRPGAEDEAKWEPHPDDTVLGYYITVTEDGGRPHLTDGNPRQEQDTKEHGMSLTDHDSDVIAMARALAEASSLEEVRNATRSGVDTYAEAFGVARVRLGDLVAIISRLDDEDDHWRDYDYTCSACGARIGIFVGREGWHHYRGDGTVASPVELYDAGHEAVLAQVTETSGG